MDDLQVMIPRDPRKAGKPSFAQLEEAVSQAPVGIAYYDRDLIFQWVNPAYASWVGRAASEFVGRCFFDVFPGTEETVGTTLRQVLATGKPFHAKKFCFVYQTPSGPDESFWDVRHLPQRDASGEVVGILTLASDISPQIDLEQETLRHAVDLQESEARFRTMVEQAPLGIAMLNPNGILFESNQALRAMLGYPEEDLRGTTLASHALPGELTSEQLFQLADAKPQEPLEIRLRRRDGSTIWCLISASAHRNFSGKVRFLTAMIEDVSAAHHAEEERLRALEELERFMETVPDILYAVDLEGRLIRWNRKVEEVTGHTAAELRNMRNVDVFYPADRPAIAEALMEGLRSGYISIEARVLSASGAPIPYHWSGVPLRDREGHLVGLGGMGRDISDLKRMEATLRTQNERLKELDRLRGDFVSTVSHELRSPLTSILGYAEFLDEDLAGPLSDQQREFVRQIMASSRRLDYLVSDLLDAARLDAGTFRLDLEEADLKAKIGEIIAGLQPQAKASQIRLEVKLPEDPFVFRFDPRRIGQVLTNLIGNAIKFSAPQSTVRLRLCRLDGTIRCEIQDQGEGIAAEDLPKLFQRFSQLEKGKKKKGTGLGLSISKSIVESHGGAIGAESRPGEGSTFWFTLPEPAQA